MGHGLGEAELAGSPVAPPPIERRTVLASAALGLVTVALPSASASASVPSAVPTGAVSYDSGDRVLAYWEAHASSDVIAPGVSGTTISTDVSGAFTAAGPVYANFTAWSSAGQPNPSLYGDGFTGLRTSNDGNTEFAGRVTTSTIDLVTTPSPTPYLEYMVTVAAPSSFRLRTFVLYAVRRGSSSGALNLAVYVRPPSGSFTLRRTAALTTTTSNLVIPLGSSDVTVASGESLTVRIYPYATSLDNAIKLYKPETASPLSALTAFDPIDAAQGRFTGWSPALTEGLDRYTGSQYQEITAAFIGSPSPA